MRRVWIGIGGNMNDPAAAVREAIDRLAAAPEFVSGRGSGLYETAPWGNTDQPWFVNAVVELETEAAPSAVLDRLLSIEQAMGRVRGERWGPRVIDLDYLLDETMTSAGPRLSLPHPEFENRAFVLVPLAELRPEMTLSGGDTVGARAVALAAEQPLRRLEGVPTIASWP